jgi:hypothetical protein
LYHTIIVVVSQGQDPLSPASVDPARLTLAGCAWGCFCGLPWLAWPVQPITDKLAFHLNNGEPPSHAMDHQDHQDHSVSTKPRTDNSLSSDRHHRHHRHRHRQRRPKARCLSIWWRQAGPRQRHSDPRSAQISAAPPICAPHPPNLAFTRDLPTPRD